MRVVTVMIAALALAASVEAIDTLRYRKSIRRHRTKARAANFPAAPALDGSERRPPLCLDEDFFGGGSSYKALAPTADEKAAAEGWRNVPKALAAELKSLIDTIVSVDGYASDHKTKHGNQVTGQSVLLYKKNPTDSNSWLRMPRCRGFAEEDHSTDILQALDTLYDAHIALANVSNPAMHADPCKPAPFETVSSLIDHTHAFSRGRKCGAKPKHDNFDHMFNLYMNAEFKDLSGVPAALRAVHTRFARLKAAILETRMLSVRRDYQELVEEYTLLGGPDFTKIALENKGKLPDTTPEKPAKKPLPGSKEEREYNKAVLAEEDKQAKLEMIKYLVLNMQEKMADLGGCLMLEPAVDKVLKDIEAFWGGVAKESKPICETQIPYLEDAIAWGTKACFRPSAVTPFQCSGKMGEWQHKMTALEIQQDYLNTHPGAPEKDVLAHADERMKAHGDYPPTLQAGMEKIGYGKLEAAEAKALADEAARATTAAMTHDKLVAKFKPELENYAFADTKLWSAAPGYLPYPVMFTPDSPVPIRTMVKNWMAKIKAREDAADAAAAAKRAAEEARRKKRAAIIVAQKIMRGSASAIPSDISDADLDKLLQKAKDEWTKQWKGKRDPVPAFPGSA